MNTLKTINSLSHYIITNNMSVHSISIGDVQRRDLVEKIEMSCPCSASCGSNYSTGGSCPCSSSCGSNYSH